MNINRTEWLDIAKGIGIILMVVGHSSIPKFASDFIYSFHMPLFFIASGWCTNWSKDRFCSFIKKKSTHLLIPFVLYSFMVLIIKKIWLGGALGDVLINGWQGTPLWFIPVLFLSLLLAKAIMSITYIYLRLILLILLVALGVYLSYINFRMPWTLSSVPYATIFIVLGSKARLYQDYINSPRWWIMIGCFLVTVIVSHFFRLDMAWNNITPVTFLTIGACAGTAMIFTLSSYIEKYTYFASRLFQSIGKETYIILAFSELPIMICNKYFTTNFIIKYSILILVLIVLKYAKDGINNLLKTKIL